MSRKWLMWAACGLMVMVGVYVLWSRGYQNILSYGMLLLCPLMHLFMHRGHDHSGRNHEESGTKSTDPEGQAQDTGSGASCH